MLGVGTAGKSQAHASLAVFDARATKAWAGGVHLHNGTNRSSDISLTKARFKKRQRSYVPKNFATSSESRVITHGWRRAASWRSRGQNGDLNFGRGRPWQRPKLTVESAGARNETKPHLTDSGKGDEKIQVGKLA